MAVLLWPACCCWRTMKRPLWVEQFLGERYTGRHAKTQLRTFSKTAQ